MEVRHGLAVRSLPPYCSAGGTSAAYRFDSRLSIAVSYHPAFKSGRTGLFV
jgi:hypothetical protein